MVANEGLEKARAYFKPGPPDRWLYIPSEGCSVNFRWKHLQNTPTHFLGAELSRLPGENLVVNRKQAAISIVSEPCLPPEVTMHQAILLEPQCLPQEVTSFLSYHRKIMTDF